MNSRKQRRRTATTDKGADALDRRPQRSYHEAAHAVVARKLGQSCIGIMMFPTDHQIALQRRNPQQNDYRPCSHGGSQAQAESPRKLSERCIARTATGGLVPPLPKTLRGVTALRGLPAPRDVLPDGPGATSPALGPSLALSSSSQ